MSNTEATEMTERQETLPRKTLILVIYALYLTSLVIGITALVGVVMAHVLRGNATPQEDSHLRFQVRTFWFALAAGVVGALLSVIGIGFLIMLAVAIWVIVRSVYGLVQIIEGQPIPDPASVLLGR